jgi:eukaryotic-like serine/threonine-protein kinase
VRRRTASCKAPKSVKTILPQIAHDPDLQQRFEWEVFLTKQINHSNLCPIYEIFHCHQSPPSLLFLTVKLLPGETLAARLRRTASISTTEGMAILEQMSAGPAAIHAASIVHPDNKPINIMLDSFGSDVRLCITDFGLASAYATAASLPAHELAAGTPDYMAPELHRGLELSQASDLFAFGVVLHQVFTGQKPLLTPDKSSVVVSPRLNTSGIPSFCVKLITGCPHSAHPKSSTEPGNFGLSVAFAQRPMGSELRLAPKSPSFGPCECV